MYSYFCYASKDETVSDACWSRGGSGISRSVYFVKDS